MFLNGRFDHNTHHLRPVLLFNPFWTLPLDGQPFLEVTAAQLSEIMAVYSTVMLSPISGSSFSVFQGIPSITGKSSNSYTNIYFYGQWIQNELIWVMIKNNRTFALKFLFIWKVVMISVGVHWAWWHVGSCTNKPWWTWPLWKYISRTSIAPKTEYRNCLQQPRQCKTHKMCQNGWLITILIGMLIIFRK